VVGEIKLTTRYPIKYVVWSADYTHVAMHSKANLYVAKVTATGFDEECSITESSRIKSGGWDVCGVFVYTTATHIKYLVPNGDNGIIRTLDTPIYITSVTSQHITYLDRETKTGKLAIDATEYLFKVSACVCAMDLWS
jgi:coatomer protein complex subunit alpha (xenin)